jgi:hypothetical protein
MTFIPEFVIKDALNFSKFRNEKTFITVLPGSHFILFVVNLLVYNCFGEQ